MKTTKIVKNLITDEKETYYNDLDIKRNLITSILHKKNIKSQLYNEKIISYLTEDIEIIHSKKSPKKYAFYQDLDLICYEQ